MGKDEKSNVKKENSKNRGTLEEMNENSKKEKSTSKDQIAEEKGTLGEMNADND